jgi:hypothetical protein
MGELGTITFAMPGVLASRGDRRISWRNVAVSPIING